ncbi:pre-mRNA-splicing ATP-dependent RNA helicase prp28-like [Drosophila navojoa]|uniref:pre-mRNA-splicing ATP-dependent RNA helicase prp28-like n=1 Tax=Drosophila navojoa TaxID=7232 RepID=UPI0011BE6963|nr:pre-mRNA-splicing ATP-dependent RNA helicase prp28-like [Drosophila navojoa]
MIAAQPPPATPPPPPPPPPPPMAAIRKPPPLPTIKRLTNRCCVDHLVNNRDQTDSRFGIDRRRKVQAAAAVADCCSDNEDESEGQRLELMPSNSSNMESQDKDNQMANEEGGECGVVAMAGGSSSNGNGSGSGKVSKGSRFKRNIKNTRSLIVRKFTSTTNSSSNSNSNSNSAEKKPSETNNKTSTSKHSSEMAEQHANANVMDNDKPNTKQKKVAMLRTTTL